MARPNFIQLFKEEPIPILYEDRSILAIDKPAGWMLVPFSWQRTNRNLQAAIASSIGAGHFWARSRNIRFLKYIHRLDAETTGILLFAKSQGALDSFGELFEARPSTGRQHQIRIHMAESGCPIVADELYGTQEDATMGLRAVGLSYNDPFSRRFVEIRAPVAEFLEYFGFAPEVYQMKFQSASHPASPRK